MKRSFKPSPATALPKLSTGSGKTNTLQGIFSFLQAPDDKKIIESADPLEVYSKYRSQMPITKTNTWMDGFHAKLRQDPDVIAIGELRSKETVNVALDAALTGHLVLSTFHTVNVETTFTRFYKMEIPRDLLADGLNMILSQRLVRVLCQECKQEDMERTKAYLSPTARAAGQRIFEPKGCPACYGQGFKGRTAIAELLYMRDEVKDWIAGGRDGKEIVKEACARQWMLTMKQVAGIKIQAGTTSFKEVERVMKLSVETPVAERSPVPPDANAPRASSSSTRTTEQRSERPGAAEDEDFIDAEYTTLEDNGSVLDLDERAKATRSPVV